MAKVVLLNLQISSLLLATVLLSGCAHSARELPPDMSHMQPTMRLLPSDKDSVEYTLSCTELKEELGNMKEKLSQIEMQMQGVQDENQAKGKTSVLVFSPAIFFIDDNKALNTVYQEMDQKKERIVRIAQSRQCPI